MNAIKRTLNYLFEDGEVFEIRAIGVQKNESPSWEGWIRKGATVLGYFNNKAKAARVIKLLDKDKAKIICVTLNKISPDLLARSKNRLQNGGSVKGSKVSEVTQYKFLFIDFDPIRLSDISSNKTEKLEAKKSVKKVMNYLGNIGWPDPLLADSGNGYHLLFRVDMSNTSENSQILEKVLMIMSSKFSNDKVDIDKSVSNPNRLIKVYGVKARKGDPTDDRPHRRSKIINEPTKTRILSKNKLLSFIKINTEKSIENKTTKSATKENCKNLSVQNKTAIKVKNFLKENNIGIREEKIWKSDIFIVLENCIFDPSHQKKDSGIGIKESGAIYYHCFHNSCKHRKWKDVVNLFNNTNISDNKVNIKKKFNDALIDDEQGDARLFIDNFRGNFAYIWQKKAWYEFNGNIWQLDTSNNVRTAVGQISKQYFNEAIRLEKKIDKLLYSPSKKELNQISQLKERGKKLNTLRRRDNVLSLAKDGLESLGKDESIWNRKKDLIGVSNGVLNIRTGKLMEGNAQDFINIELPVDWAGINAKPKKFKKFLMTSFEGNIEIINFLQRLFGYVLSGKNTENIFVIFYGEKGRNGKTTLSNIMSRVFGPLSAPIRTEILMKSSFVESGSAHNAGIASLMGKNLVFASESDRRVRIDEARVKQLTGSDPISVRAPYQKEAIVYHPQHTLFLLTNELPKINSRDNAIWNRILAVEFPISFVDNPVLPHEKLVDKSLLEKLIKEKSEILAWVVRGYRKYLKYGLNPPAEVLKTTKKYRNDQDTVGRFLKERCKVNRKLKSWKVQAQEIQEEFAEWQKEENISYEDCLSKNKLSDNLIEMGFKRVNIKRKRYYKGLKIKMNQ